MKKTALVSVNISTQFIPVPFHARWTQWMWGNHQGTEDADVQFDWPFINLGAGIIGMARLQQVQHFLQESKAEWFVNIDCDETWEHDGISKLLNTDSDVISAVVHSKVAPYEPCFFTWDGQEFKNGKGHIPGQEFAVDAVGFGFIGIRRPVLEVLYQKYDRNLFERPRYNKWNNIYLGEDVTFCYKAAEMGYKISVNPNIDVGHLAYTPITRKDYYGHQE